MPFWNHFANSIAQYLKCHAVLPDIIYRAFSIAYDVIDAGNYAIVNYIAFLQMSSKI